MATIANCVALQNNFETRMNEEILFLESNDGLRLKEQELQSRLNEVEYEFSLVRERHDKIFLAKVQESSKKYLEENSYSLLRSKYHKVWGLISDRLPKHAPNNEVFNSTFANSHCNKSINEIKLNKMTIPTFGGNYREWMNFNNLFTKTIHDNTNIDPIVKLQHLKSMLSGDAESLVRNLELNDANYLVARRLLTNRYQHTRRLVNSYLKCLHDFPVMETETSESLKSMLNVLNDSTSALTLLEVDIKDYQTVYLMCRKLPASVLTLWEASHKASTDLSKYEKFIEFLEVRFRTMEMIEPSEQPVKTFHVTKSNQASTSKPKPKKSENQKPKPKTLKNSSCILCKSNHYLGKCQQFINMQQSSRFDTVKRLNCCLNCFNNSHTTKNCWSTRGCKVCNKRHHTLLHRYVTPDPQVRLPVSQNSNPNNITQPSSTHMNSQLRPPSHSNSNSTAVNNPSQRAFHINSKEQMGSLLGTAQVRAMSPVGISMVVRALIDPCSEDNYILCSTVRILHLQQYYSPSIIGVLGEDHASDCTHRVELHFKSFDETFSMKISAGVVKNITSCLPSMQLPATAFENVKSLNLADQHFNDPGEIQLLLGVNVHTKIMLGDYERLGEYLIAENTLLGHLIRGQVQVQAGRPSLAMMTQSSTANLNSQIQKFWEIEEVNSKPPMHPDDALCEQIFKSSIYQDSNGFLTVDLPFKTGQDPIIGPSRTMAVKRFLSLERKLNLNQNLKKEYHDTIKNYLNSNHLSEVTDSLDNGYYLPHHAVVKESSTTTKVRVVFDASCRSLDGSSLNDHLLTGPKLQRDIREVLFNWRQYPLAITADIEKMYRMFFVNSKHHQFQKIVWRFNEEEPIQDFALRTVTFGTSSAPYLAIRCLQYIAEMHESTSPVASQAILKEFYVDDFISGGFTIEQTLEKQTAVRAILKQYNLSLRKWSSNDRRTISNVPSDLLDMSKDLAFDETDFRKTLGIFWSQKQDSFYFSIALPDDLSESFTKRQILSLIARLYDPLGWVSPCTMLAKQIMQKIWQTKSGWDDIVEDSLSNQFKEFLFQLPELMQFSIPRWTQIFDNTSALTLLGFSDASDKGYSAVIYLVNPDVSAKEKLLLLSSRTKVADLKFQSTARLELNGALLLSDLLKWAVSLYQPRTVTVEAFCDSKIVLAWLQGHPSKWKTYIANRTSQILDWMKPSQWHYVDTKINPADCASRGLLPRDLISHSLWINGPNIQDLNYEQNHELSEEHHAVIAESVKKNSVVLHSRRKTPFPLLSYFSNHARLVKRVDTLITYVKNTLQNLLTKSSPHDEKYRLVLTNFEIAEDLIFRLLQSEFYHEEINCLKHGRELKKDSKIYSLYPFLDGNGILRVSGRLQNADLTFNQQHPIILPAKHQIVTNLISEAHEKTIHGTELLTQAYLRNRFHIPRVSEKVRSFIHGCMTCFKFSKQQQEFLMGSLPTPRVNFTNPFEHSGVDYAGPLTIKAYRGRCKKFLKGYIAIFVCLCTKAIHIELVSDLTSLSFLAAFKRFSGRRGRCSRLYSDNGTNFVGANKILLNDIKLAEQTWKTELEQDFHELGTEWHFIPPATPHFGGLWEAAVKSTKSHLKKTVGASLMTFEEMNTVLIQIEAVLNSRPLCSLSNNPNEYSYLTPAHFLIGRPLVAPPEKCFEMDKIGPLQRWQHCQATYQRFVKLWKRDYLQNLLHRPKGYATTVHYKIGDLVLLAEDESPPTLWPMVIIDQTHPGQDGIVRVVTVRTSNGKTFKRPVVKLRLLPCNIPAEQ